MESGNIAFNQNVGSVEEVRTGLSEVRDVDRGWLLWPGSSQILSANVT